MSDITEDLFSLEIKFKGNSLNLSDLRRTHTIGYLKSLIYDQTTISPENQKLLGFKALSGFTLDDSRTFDELIIPSNCKILLMGSTQEEIKGINSRVNRQNTVLDDFDCKKLNVDISKRSVYIAKVDRRIKEYKVTLIEKPRPESNLLVLDIDYTIFDHRSTAQNVRELMRPFLHEFLGKVYPKYDIAIWSATGMSWIKTKLFEMGLISRSTSQNMLTLTDQLPQEYDDRTEQLNVSHSENLFKISMVLDQGAMISVDFPDEGVKEVKPLNVIWANYPQWGPHNTIMFDDIQRNFVMNPQSGLKIKPYKHSPRTRETDRELLDLATYLDLISLCKDFTRLNHKNWRRYTADNNSVNPSKRSKIEK